MNFDEAVSYLYSLGHETLALKLGLKTTEVLLSALGNPQTQYPSVQIAGTNGKGSTAVVLDSICRAAGIQTGLFTSPHLVSITERVRIDGLDISQELFAELASLVRETSDQLVDSGEFSAPPTFFEQTTAIGLLAFERAKIELAILETGLGGRLDSTTVARAHTVGITPIALDHQEYLGETLAEIAAEKAAIIREGATVVIGPQEPPALDVILQRCASVKVIPRLSSFAADDFFFTKDGRLRTTLTTSLDSYPDLTLGLLGRHQMANSALAIELAESLRDEGFDISKDAIAKGVEHACHPGRLEVIEGSPRVLLDGAHNPAGAHALRSYLDEFVSEPITMIFGAMRDKNLQEMASTLFPRASMLILTMPDNPRAASLETLLQLPAENRAVKLAPSAKAAFDLAIRESPADSLICVTGSLYLVGEVREFLSDRHLLKPGFDY
jgi:dihydrofolate synthase/folylpolyglutamate synthase